MKISSIRIENFRSFRDQTIELDDYACLVGPNGAGKSGVLAALNVFFQERTSATDSTKLIDEDYHLKRTEDPVRITLTFDQLGGQASLELSDYARQGKLVVTAQADFDPNVGYGEVRHFGQRLGFDAFRRFFEEGKKGARASELAEIYTELREQFRNLPNPRSKDDKKAALQQYEASHPDECVLIESTDNFYGINGTGKLAAHLQWVYVPAVKDARDEGQEGRDTAIGKLVARAVQARTHLTEELDSLREEALAKYRQLLERNQDGLNDIAAALRQRLASWAHSGVQLDLGWRSDPARSVVLQTPVAGISAGEGDFIGSLSRLGHGLQRSYLLALLQELAGSDAPDAPTLILGCEEPELYQHPPQARHLADTLLQLAAGNNQVIVTTHSPLFVAGDGCEHIRLVHRSPTEHCSSVRHLTFDRLCARIRTSRGQDVNRPTQGLIAKIHQALQPGIAEMFFARVPILVEGLEDVSYLVTWLYLSGRWAEFRRLGCHIVPVHGKDKLIQPLAICVELSVPVFTVFDADGDVQRTDHRTRHEADNRALLALLNSGRKPFPEHNVIETDFAMWSTNLGDAVKTDFGADYERLTNAARVRYSHEGGLEKHDLFIADWLASGWVDDVRSRTLEDLSTTILDFAATH
jgi:putative ATP-dependent endonuclease of OLD family